MRRAGLATLAGAVALTLTLGSARSIGSVALGYCAESELAAITGTNGADNLVGTPASEFIVGLGGDDVIDGGGGEDTICGGDGNDRLFGGAGWDELSGDRGDDYLDGGFEPEGRHDVVMYEGASGSVTVDLIAGRATGGHGSDQILGVEGIYGSDFADVLIGTAFDDVLVGEGGNDRLDGKDGQDLLTGSSGNDTVIGGLGVDTASYWSGPAVRANLSTRTVIGWGRDRLVMIEDLDGSDYADTLIGDRRGNYIRGFDGNDRIVSAGGPDILEGMFGDDVLDGGAGRDRGDGGIGRDRCKRVERKRSC